MTGEGRFVSAVDLDNVREFDCDVAVFGSGIAGLTVACALPEAMQTLVFSKGPYGEGSTPYAQGGIAAAVGADDDPALHAKDTLTAGVGICDPVAVGALTNEAPDAIAFLEKLGTRFDREGDRIALTLEGGHSRRRIVHAGGDASGAEISRALFTYAESREVSIINEAFLVDLLLDDFGDAAGAIVLIGNEICLVRFSFVVFASGGAGQLYASTTSPSTCTGDGMAVAYRAGAELADLEFVQFHPTVLQSTRDPRPLISEALRGEGSVLRDATGNLVMEGLHPRGDLAPRDVISREMVKLMHRQGVDHLYLDARPIAATIRERFPTISSSLEEIGIDPGTEMIPVSPASHYSIGGVRTSVDGESSIARLYAVGEVASVGIHGANRLASNSLLEGVVFGRRIAQHITGERRRPRRASFLDVPTTVPAKSLEIDRNSLRRAMDLHAGVIRQREGLEVLLESVMSRPLSAMVCDQPRIESANMQLLSELTVRLSLERTESRGAHYRTDLPTTSKDWLVRQIVVLQESGDPAISRFAPFPH